MEGSSRRSEVAIRRFAAPRHDPQAPRGFQAPRTRVLAQDKSTYSCARTRTTGGAWRRLQGMSRHLEVVSWRRGAAPSSSRALAGALMRFQASPRVLVRGLLLARVLMPALVRVPSRMAARRRPRTPSYDHLHEYCEYSSTSARGTTSTTGSSEDATSSVLERPVLVPALVLAKVLAQVFGVVLVRAGGRSRSRSTHTMTNMCITNTAGGPLRVLVFAPYPSS